MIFGKTLIPRHECMLYNSIFMLPYGRHGFLLPPRISEKLNSLICQATRQSYTVRGFIGQARVWISGLETGCLETECVRKRRRKRRNEVGYRRYPSHCLCSLLDHDTVVCKATARLRQRKTTRQLPSLGNDPKRSTKEQCFLLDPSRDVVSRVVTEELSQLNWLVSD
jgi:hypothetical protein